MFERERYDALVVGARCAGAAAAMLMARGGMRVLLVDRGEYGADTISTHALMRGGVLQLHRWGLLPRLVAAGTPAIRVTAFHYDDETPVTIAMKPSHGVEALYAPRRTVLDRLLVDAARGAGVEVRHGVTLTGLRRRPDGRVTGGTLLDASGRVREVEANLVVGADGIGSSVARLAGAGVLREARHATAILYGHWAGLDVGDAYRWYYREGISAGVMPTNGGLHCAFVAVPSARFREVAAGDPMLGYRGVAAEISSCLAVHLADARLAGPLRVFAGRRGFLRQAWGAGWALAGDAGFFKDPLTAHGMTDALRDAELLAAAALRGSAAAFARYASTRDALSLPLLEATDAIASFAWDLDALKGHHQALNAAMRCEVEHLGALGAADGSFER